MATDPVARGESGPSKLIGACTSRSDVERGSKFVVNRKILCRENGGGRRRRHPRASESYKAKRRRPYGSAILVTIQRNRVVACNRDKPARRVHRFGCSRSGHRVCRQRRLPV